MNLARRHGLVPVVLLVACGGDPATSQGGGDLSAISLPSDGGRAGDGAGAAGGDLALTGGADLAAAVGDLALPCVQRACQGKVYQCGDCIDNDGDGRIDADDPDCLGACQNGEAGFNGDIPQGNRIIHRHESAPST